MAATTARKRTVQDKEPQDIPLPPSPDSSVDPLPAKKTKGRAKNKNKRTDAGHAPPNAKATQKEQEQAKQWSWSYLADTKSSLYSPVFTKDGRYFFCVVGSEIKIYSSANGHLVSTLSGSTDEDPTETITSVILNPHNAFQLITGSLSGTIKVWDFLEGVLLHTVRLGEPIYRICAHEQIKDFVFVASAKSKKNENNNKNASNSSKERKEVLLVLRVALKPDDFASSKPRKATEIMTIGKISTVTGLAISASGQWLVATSGHKSYVAMTSSLDLGFTKFVSPEGISCLAVHPSEDYFATGDDKGVIRLWYCLDRKLMNQVVGVEKRAQTTTLHWHAHAVSSLAFTPNGAYLMSGGEEAVLVIWELQSGKKEFVPRVGAAIKHVVASRTNRAEEYLLSLADASFTFIDASTLKISKVFSRLRLPSAESIGWPSTSRSVPLAVHSLSSTLILPSSHPSSLQTFSISSSRLVAELEVSPSNRVSRRDEKELEPSRVEYAVVSSDGGWLATVDRREGDEIFRGEIYLKIWSWDRRLGIWILNTRLDRPHGLKRLISVSFSPVSDGSLPLLMTIAGDGHIKTWRIRKSKDKKGVVEESWTLRSSFNTHSASLRYATWSPDGTLVAISCATHVALYDPLTNILRHQLSSPELKNASSAHFIGSSGRHLAVVSGADVILWDLLADKVCWYYRCQSPIRTIISHPQDEIFALLHFAPTHPETHVAVFGVSSATPHLSCSLPFGLLNFAWSHDPTQSGSFSLVGITDNFGIVAFGSSVTTSTEVGSSTRPLSNGLQVQRKKGLFEEMFGVSAFSASSAPSGSKMDTALPWQSSETAGMFNMPAYLLPPMDTMFEPLITSFLKLRTEEQIEDGGDGGVEQNPTDSEMLVDDKGFEATLLSARPNAINDNEQLGIYASMFQEIFASSDYAFHSASSAQPQRKSTPPKPSSKALPRSPKVQAQTPAMAATPQPIKAAPVQVGKKRSRRSMG